MYQHMEVLVIVNLFFRLFPTASTFIETLSGFFRRAMGLKTKKTYYKDTKEKRSNYFLINGLFLPHRGLILNNAAFIYFV